MTETPHDQDDDPRSIEAVSRLLHRQTTLEERVGKLETALAERPASMPPSLEDAVADRVIAKLVSVAPHRSASDRVLVLDSPVAEPPPPPSGAVPQPQPTAPGPSRPHWFLLQLVAELRLAVHMYFDPRYRISRTAQFALPGIALLILLNYFLFSTWMTIPIVNPVVERLLDLVLAVVAYRLLTRELVRYREVLDYLQRYRT